LLKLEGARESAYLRQVNFYRRSFLIKIVKGHVWTVPGNMHVKFEVRSFNLFTKFELSMPFHSRVTCRPTVTQVRRISYLSLVRLGDQKFVTLNLNLVSTSDLEQ